MLAPPNEEKPLTFFLTSFNLNLVGDMVIYLLGTLEPNLPIFIGSLDTFHIIVLPSN